MSIDIKNHADKLYSLRVNDYSSPGFVSCDICYYGTEQEIMNLLRNGEKRADMIKAAEEYFSGRGPGEASVLGEQPQPIIKPVKIIGEAEYQKSSFNYKFFNIWNCLTDLSIEHLEAAIIYIEDSDKKIKRCIRAVIRNATYISEYSGEKCLVGDSCLGFWGYPGFIVEEKDSTSNHILRNSLYYVDTIFKNKLRAKKDMKHPHKPYLRQFFFGIYGDG